MKKLTDLGKYVIFSISYTILYSITVIILACYGVQIPDVLTEYTYKFFAGEVIVCGLIKIFKIVPINNVKSRLNEAVGFLLEQEPDDIDS